MNVIDLAGFILHSCGVLSGLVRVKPEDLKAIPGIGPREPRRSWLPSNHDAYFSRAIRRNGNRRRLTRPEDIYGYVRYDMESPDHEELCILCRDTKHYLLAVENLHK